MKKICYCFVVLFLLQTWTFAADPHPGTCNQQFSCLNSRQVVGDDHQELGKYNDNDVVEINASNGVSRIGSKPPKCQHRCGECEPCIAIQVPATTLSAANYQPESWKCKCQTSFFDP